MYVGEVRSASACVDLSVHERRVVSPSNVQVLDVFSDLFIYIFDNLNARFGTELEAINKQHPFEPLQVRALPLSSIYDVPYCK